MVADDDSLDGNALLQVGGGCGFAGVDALADVTARAVDALGGAPGVYSARFAGPDASYGDNLARLLHELQGIAVPQRTARFRTVAVVYYPDGSALSAEGVVEGTILEASCGSGGFGYDPVFAPTESDGRSFAEMSSAAKHAVSHRGRALRALVKLLPKRF